MDGVSAAEVGGGGGDSGSSEEAMSSGESGMLSSSRPTLGPMVSNKKIDVNHWVLLAEICPAAEQRGRDLHRFEQVVGIAVPQVLSGHPHERGLKKFTIPY